jgi:hypothetical protein
MNDAMATEKTLFSQGEMGIGNEDCYYLVSDSESGEEFVMHEWSQGGLGGLPSGAERFSVEEFLKKSGSAQNELRDLLKSRAG